MTVSGNEIICNCRKCYCDHGYGIRLREKNGVYVCERDPGHKYVVADGFMKSL